MRNRIGERASDEDLMAAVAKGDRFAFEILVSRHQNRILNTIYRFVGDRTDAEDLAQDVFLRIWLAAGRYKPTAKFTSWAYRITANLCINQLKATRRKKLFQSVFTHLKTHSQAGEHLKNQGKRIESPEALLLAKEGKQQIWSAIQSLPAKQRMAVVLKRYEGLSYCEIAQILECSVAAVDSLLVRAKRNLKKKMGWS
jgi:RNA polymerase sigma-70 factor (ECF subfamily)